MGLVDNENSVLNQSNQSSDVLILKNFLRVYIGMVSGAEC